MPNHGDRRNRRTERQTTVDTWQTAHGPIKVERIALEQSVDETWCTHCQEWVTTKGIMGALLCPKCNTPWKEP